MAPGGGGRLCGLLGLSFRDLEALGYDRKPVAFEPDAELWDSLGECSPTVVTEALACDSPLLELDKAAYGLQDAVLLWHLRVDRFL